MEGDVRQTTLLVNRSGKKALPFFLPYAALASVVLVKRRKIELVHLCDALLAPVGLLVKKMTVPITAAIIHITTFFTLPLLVLHRLVQLSTPHQEIRRCH